jgi:hypothetical protein
VYEINSNPEEDKRLPRELHAWVIRSNVSRRIISRILTDNNTDHFSVVSFPLIICLLLLNTHKNSRRGFLVKLISLTISNRISALCVSNKTSHAVDKG